MLACDPVFQVGRLIPKDSSSFEEFGEYLAQRKQVALVPLHLDMAIIGHMLLFPSELPGLCERFQVPDTLRHAGFLLSVLLPWKGAPPEDSRPLPSTLLPKNILHPQYIRDQARWDHSFEGTNSRYQLALRLLSFPKEIHDFLLVENRTEPCGCFVWFEGADRVDDPENNPGDNSAGLQTLLLYSILEKCRAVPLDASDGNVKVVFVHVGALETLGDFPNLVQRRRDQPGVLWYTYGSHPDVPRNLWGVHALFTLGELFRMCWISSNADIFCIGGVVTFTPRCLAEVSPTELVPLIDRLIEHPLWDFYLLPEVLGAATRAAYPNTDPLQALSQ